MLECIRLQQLMMRRKQGEQPLALVQKIGRSCTTHNEGGTMNYSNVIYFRYTLKDAAGNLIETTGQESIPFIEGKNTIFRPVEQELSRCRVGEKKTVAIDFTEGFGHYDDSLLFEVPASQLGEDVQPGDALEIEAESGHQLTARVIEFQDDTAILDGNHPLAGTDLLFEFEVTKRRLATASELSEKPAPASSVV